MRRSIASLGITLCVAFAIANAEPTESQAERFGIQPTALRVDCRMLPLDADSHASWRENRSFLIEHSAAQFLVVRFAWVRLPPGARVVVHDAREIESDSSTVLEGDHGMVYSRPLYTQRAIVEYTVPLWTEGIAGACYGFAIDEYRFAARTEVLPPSTTNHRVETLSRSETIKQVGSVTTPGGGNCEDATASSAVGSASGDPLSQCVDGSDGSLRVACVQYDTTLFAASRAIARLLIHKASGSIFCTGWLFGCEGHVLTNHHCVGSESDANATAIEFLAQGRDCSQSCEQPMGCPGVVEATSAAIVASSPTEALDFTLLLPRLPPPQRQQLTTTYGFLSMRAQAPDLTERIFIPQHPAGFGKRVALKHGAAYGRVLTRSDAGCNARSQSLGYLLDTEGGSSGAPVIAYADRAVVGLHNCGGCLSSAIPASQILEALADASALPDCARV